MASAVLSRFSTFETRPAATRLPVFDILRAVAALLVFFYHYAGLAAPFTHGAPMVDAIEWTAARVGSIGTNLLLLLSGYFLANNFASGRFSYPRFVWLRVARIYAPYLTVLILAVGFSALAPAYTRLSAGSLSWRTLLEQTLLLPGLFPERPILTVTWTLSYIVAGYITLPLVAMALRRRQAAASARVATWAALVALNLLLGLTAGLPPARFAYIPAGYLLFELRGARRLPLDRPGILRWTAAASLSAIAYRALLDGRLIGANWPEHFGPLSFVLTGLIAACAIAISGIVLQDRHPSLGDHPAARALAAFGRTGYSFYLVHGPVVKLYSALLFPALLRHALPPAALWLAAPACLAAAGAAALLYLGVEKPCRRHLLGH